jgi:hypothetical protein
VTYTPPGTSSRATLPERLPGLRFAGRGARMLALGIDVGGGRTLRYATAELLARSADGSGAVTLVFAAAPGERFEIGTSGPNWDVTVAGARIEDDGRGPGRTGVIVIAADRDEVEVTVPAT